MSALDFDGGVDQKEMARRMIPTGHADVDVSRIVALRSSRKGEAIL